MDLEAADVCWGRRGISIVYMSLQCHGQKEPLVSEPLIFWGRIGESVTEIPFLRYCRNRKRTLFCYYEDKFGSTKKTIMGCSLYLYLFLLFFFLLS